jgi:Holliday junction resolvase RusA-like endonuclease
MSEAATMTEQVTFTLPGTPTAKGRPRFYNGRAVTDAKTRAAEQSILSAWLYSVGNREPHTGPVEVQITATFTAAQSWPKWRKQLAASGLWPHLSKPDLDNLIKVLDGLNSVAWVDDSQIFRVSASKQYGPVAETQVTILFYPTPTKP